MVSSSDIVRAPKADRDCNTEPPASPYAIMRRVHPYRGENSGAGQGYRSKADTQTAESETISR